MKKIVLLLVVCVSIINCSDKNDIDNIVIRKWNACTEKSNCNINFAYLMTFEWDTMCFYSAANSLEDINRDLGFELKEFTDVGDRLIFLNKGRFVYQKEWFYDPNGQPEGIVFITDSKKFKTSRADAKFGIKKNGKIFYLEKR